YGIGEVRAADSILGSGAWARAFVVDNGRQAIALVESDNQGTFAAYDASHGDVGTIDIAKAAQAATNGGIQADHIVIASDHSHAGQDLIGVWGGVPNAYLQYVKQQTTAAIVHAYDQREFANLSI